MLSPFQWLADAVVHLLGLNPAGHFALALNFFVDDLFKITALILVISWVMGLVRAAVPMAAIRGWLSHSRFRALGYPVAAAFGAITPFCSCSSVPLTIGFLEAGIPLGITFAFLLTSPLVNEIVVALFLASFGWEIAVLYVISGMSIGIVGGLVIGALKIEHWVEDFVWKIRQSPAGAVQQEVPTWRERVNFATHESLTITRQVLPYLGAALLLGALIHGYLPADYFARWFGGSDWWSVPLATLIGLPLYASANATVPVLETLVQKGIPLGTAMAFLMSAVGVSLPELIILRKVMKVKLLVVFTVVAGVGTILVGYLFNAIGYVR